MNAYVLRPARRFAALFAILALMLFQLPTVERDAPVGDARGTGWGSVAACIGCGAAAITILSSGAGAVLAALYFPGSGLAAAGCIAACVEAVH